MKLTDLSLKDFTAKLGSDAPAPGGGSAAALSGALGAALDRRSNSRGDRVAAPVDAPHTACCNLPIR